MNAQLLPSMSCRICWKGVHTGTSRKREQGFIQVSLDIDVLIHRQLVQLAAQPGNRDIPGPQFGLVDGDSLAKNVT